MLRCHRREQYLSRVLISIAALCRNRTGYLCIQLDRPSTAVTDELGKAINRLPQNIHVDIFETPIKLVAQGENYMEALRIQYDRLLDWAPEIEAAALWDDDMWLPPKGRREINGHLDYFDMDRLDIETRFLWDDENTYNAEFPKHLQTLIFRVLPGDQYATDYIAHAPDRAAQSKARVLLSNPLINAGLMFEDDRKLTFDAYKKAGKLDRHTTTLVRPPKLRKL